MIISPRKVWLDEGSMRVGLNDTRVVGVPLAWLPRLLSTTVAEREQFELSAFDIHWEHLDENISIEGLLAGQGDLTRTPIEVA